MISLYGPINYLHWTRPLPNGISIEPDHYRMVSSLNQAITETGSLLSLLIWHIITVSLTYHIAPGKFLWIYFTLFLFMYTPLIARSASKVLQKYLTGKWFESNLKYIQNSLEITFGTRNDFWSTFEALHGISGVSFSNCQAWLHHN